MTAAIANERLRKRFAKWDLDGSGRLERSDFEKEAVQIVQAFGKNTDGAEAQSVQDALTGMFEYLAGEAGTTAGGSLSEDEFVRVTQKLIFEDGEEQFNRVLGPLVRSIVGLCDKNDDGKIDAAEFASWLTAVGVDRSQAAEAFVNVDTDANGELTVDELLAAVRDFHFGRLDVELLG
ncbi:EF-hand domain-containing protein [Saccharopolyspora sp. NFXS83]|uniref:EF-hand domain-containing protein n=1 Tax=Saccharopolyspora sp. NFXS83 TaxID=2993560 RepID=UPI00224A6D61|nr:EF-hand domain-containing protein [Saccharopolyspora sp. NFXS83]MCX2729649.1 EF-hand domain-containing protein [Saccharopolyspora sp. NFXS83]